jgi:hypothetical protein
VLVVDTVSRLSTKMYYYKLNMAKTDMKPVIIVDAVVESCPFFAPVVGKVPDDGLGRVHGDLELEKYSERKLPLFLTVRVRVPFT